MLGVMALACAGVGGPTTFPATINSERAKALLGKLADLDATTRTAARAELLSLHRRDLPVLKEAVREAGTLTSEQVRVLEDVVKHVFLTEEPYVREADAGFLGISIARAVPLVRPEGQAADNTPQVIDPASGERVPGGPVGIVVSDLTPGLASFRYLEIGDVITGVDTVRELNSSADFQNIIKARKAGQSVELHILRLGKPVDVRAVLSSRPEALSAPGMTPEVFRAIRDKPAAEYWEAEFGTLLGLEPAAATQPDANAPSDGGGGGGGGGAGN